MVYLVLQFLDMFVRSLSHVALVLLRMYSLFNVFIQVQPKWYVHRNGTFTDVCCCAARVKLLGRLVEDCMLCHVADQGHTELRWQAQ